MEYVRCLSAVARCAVYVVYDICRSLCLGNEGADRRNALVFTHGLYSRQGHPVSVLSASQVFCLPRCRAHLLTQSSENADDLGLLTGGQPTLTHLLSSYLKSSTTAPPAPSFKAPFSHLLFPPIFRGTLHSPSPSALC